jgi:hypothetical protein
LPEKKGNHHALKNHPHSVYRILLGSCGKCGSENRIRIPDSRRDGQNMDVTLTGSGFDENTRSEKRLYAFSLNTQT